MRSQCYHFFAQLRIDPGSVVEVFQYVYYRRHMDMTTTLKALSALAQEYRLNAFRLLVGSGSEGLGAGQIARQRSIPHNALSSHLSIPSSAGLIASHRESRSIIHHINFYGARELLRQFRYPIPDSPGEQHEKNAR